MSNPKDTKTMRSLVEAANKAKKPTKANPVADNEKLSKKAESFAYGIESELSRASHEAVRCMHSVDPSGNTIHFHIFIGSSRINVTLKNSFKAVGFSWTASVVVSDLPPAKPMDTSDIDTITETYAALSRNLKSILHNLNRY